MAQQKIELTNTPRDLGSNPQYVSSHGGNFRFSFGATAPNLSNVDGQSDHKLSYDGSLGKLWVWKSISAKVILEISTAS